VRDVHREAPEWMMDDLGHARNIARRRRLPFL
jgi:hypothetical protein